MKRINPPLIDDFNELDRLSRNSRLGSYPALQLNIETFKSCYHNYLRNNGDPWGINSINIASGLKNSLIQHYESTPVGSLDFIDEFRRTLSPDVCPMCGGFGTGTLDHYLPKDDYPEFSFFSKNLVPACMCNSLRGKKLKGTSSPQRIIHPFFDDFLRERLYQTTFSGDFNTPEISIEIIDKTHPNIETLDFHLRTVVINDSSIGWFSAWWTNFCSRPHHILRSFIPDGSITLAILTASILRLRQVIEDEYDTPNNWKSMFYTGLLNNRAYLERIASIINELRES